MRKLLTIITPTYNRAYILSNAYNSLCRQTEFNFEWIIVDDGSTDNTEEIVKGWLHNSLPFEIRYYKQENNGKHIAVNKGVDVARYDYVFILDSDDYLTDDAVQNINDWIKTIDDQSEFAGVSGLKGWIKKDGCIGGSGTGKAYVDAKYNEKQKYKLGGDKAEVYKTKILREHPFPKFEGENFCPENVIWYSIAEEGYKLRWFNRIICKCEYLEDGLTRGNNGFASALKNFNAFTLSSAKTIKLEHFPLSYFTIGLYEKIAKIKGLTQKEIKRNISVNNFQLFAGKVTFLLNDLRKRFAQRNKFS